jgi:hypothetical protein
MDKGLESSFSLVGLEMTIKPTCLDKVLVLHLTNAGVEPYFPLVGLHKSDLVILTHFYKSDRHPKPDGCEYECNFSPDYFIIGWIFVHPT